MDQNPKYQSADNDLSTSLRRFGIVGILFTITVIMIGNVMLPNMIMLPVGALLVIIWVRITETPWREIGYVKPKNWIAMVVTGIILGVTFKFLMKAIVTPL